MTNATNREKVRSDDRILQVELIPNKKFTGMLDQRLFKKETTLHARKNPQLSMWTFHYEQGPLPVPLRQRFTTFSALKAFADHYFEGKGARIVEVID